MSSSLSEPERNRRARRPPLFDRWPEANSDVGQTLFQPVYAGLGDFGASGIELFQVQQAVQMLQTGIADLGESD